MTMTSAEKTSMAEEGKEATDNPPQRSSISVQHDIAAKSALPAAKDIGEDLYREIDNFTPEELEAERIRVRKLIDWRIMPIV
jgi:hypothetical protein